ncbi:MAG: hypothetical protein ACE14V_04650 [bacterium]
MKRSIIIILIAVIVGVGFYIGYRQAISPTPIFPGKASVPSQSGSTTPRNYQVDTTVTFSSNSPDFTKEKALQMNKEIQELKAQGKYELIKVVENPNGKKTYIYKFKLADGEEVAWGSQTPLATP